MTFLLGLEVLVCAYAFRRCLKIPLGVGFMIYVCATITILYMADFVGLLWHASFAIHAIILVCGGFFIWSGRQALLAGRLWQVHLRTFAVGASILLLFTQASLLTAPAQFHNWDEFSHWGTVIRTIFTADTYHLNPNPLYFQDYPPALALFAYHVLTLIGFTEGNAYFSYVLLLGCLSASLLQMAARVSFARFAFSVLIIWLCVEFIAEGWISVLVDHVLALFFMACLASYLLLRERGKHLFLLPVFLFAFALTKQAASSFALLALGIVLLDLLISRPALGEVGAIFWPRFTVLVIGLFGAVWLASYSWNSYVAAAGFERGWGSYSPVGALGNVVGCCTTSREIDVARTFFGRFFGNDQTYAGGGPAGSLAYQAWLGLASGPWTLRRAALLLGSPFAQLFYLLLANLTVAMFAGRSLDRWRTIAFSCLMAAGAVGYLFSLLVAYLYSFSQYEALNLASFSRFFSVFIIAWITSMLAYYAMAVPDPESPRLRRFAHLGLAIGLVALVGVQVWRTNIILTPRSYHLYVANQKGAERDLVQALVRPMLPSIPPNAKVYILWPDNTGYEFWLTKYELLPRQTNVICFAVTSKPEPGFVQECAFSEQEFRKQLSNYDFVIVGQKLDRLREEFPGLFAGLLAGKKTGLFRVDTTPVLKLTPL